MQHIHLASLQHKYNFLESRREYSLATRNLDLNEVLKFLNNASSVAASKVSYI